MQKCAVQTEEAVLMPISFVFPGLNRHTHTGLLEHCACNVKPMDFKETVSLQFKFGNTVQMQLFSACYLMAIFSPSPLDEVDGSQKHIHACDFYHHRNTVKVNRFKTKLSSQYQRLLHPR